VRGDPRNAGRFGVRLDELPDDLLPETFASNSIRAGYGKENATLGHTRRRCPCVDCNLDPGRHRRRPNSAVLAYQIDDAPTSIALLEVGERQRGHLGTPQPAAQENGQDGAVTQSADRRDIRRAQQSLGLAQR